MSTTLFSPKISRANLENSRWYVPHLFSHLISSEATDGETALIHFHGRSGGEPPLHIHSREDEFFYILEGSFAFEAGGQKMAANPGTFVWLPKDIEHGFKATSKTGKGLLGFTPGTFESWFLDYSMPAEAMELPRAQDPSYLLDVEAMLKSGNALGVEFLPPTTTSTQPNPLARTQPFAADRDSSDSIVFAGMLFSILAPSTKTNRELTAIELEMDPGVSTPLHTKAVTELAYVLEGKVRYQLGDKVVEAGPGTSVLVPSDTLTGYRNIGTGNSRLLHLIFGGESDALLRQVQPLFSDPASHAEEIGMLLGRYGWNLIGREIAD